MPRLVAGLVQGLHKCREELRTVLHGLLPVAVDKQGLMAALADRTRQDHQVACDFACPVPVADADNLTAIHLYPIAREAVHNTVKHARPRHIHICLEAGERLLLRVRDDGRGMPDTLPPTQGVR